MKLNPFIKRLPNFPFFTRGKKIEHYKQQQKNMEEKDLNTQNDTFNDTLNINADENAAGSTHLNEPVEEENQIQKLQDEINEQKDKYLRLMAEFDNFRRRTAKERLETIQTAGKDVVISLLDVLDDCDRAEKQLQTSDNIELQKEGIQLVFNKIRSTLQSKGVKVMDSINTEFDVEKHEAITEIPAPTEALKGKVLDEVTKGYYLNDKIIRFAKVVVGK
ncbi:nucleotide exchange factor GrpE [Parasediminibacterium paludis]|uniref:Protein GrpE n=1 Tax=Parasediminibacterium paludis TaxID=908966 RepID=A0ABV8PUK0_9BACT